MLARQPTNIVTVKKVHRYIPPTLSGERPSPLARLFFCQVLLGCDESIDWYTHHTNNNNISVGNFKHRKGINIVNSINLYKKRFIKTWRL